MAAPSTVPPPPHTDRGRHVGWLPWAALLVVYVVWGSTYLAIRVGVGTVPPLVLAGTRYLAAGAVLLPVALRLGGPALRAADRPARRQWAAAAVVGTLLLAMGNGGVSVAEQTVPSGLAALLVGTVPLWMVAVDRLVNGTPVKPLAAAALVVGLVGVGILSQPGRHGGEVWGVLVVLGAAASWGTGSVLAGRLALPARPLVGSALEMLCGGTVLLVAGAVSGELADLDLGAVSGASWAAWLYLVGPGSLLALSAYVVALQRLPTSTVATYAYVNPVVAVFLGAVLLDEVVTRRVVVGAAVVVSAVALTVWTRRRADRPVDRVPPDGAASEPEVTGGGMGR